MQSFALEIDTCEAERYDSERVDRLGHMQTDRLCVRVCARVMTIILW